MKSTSNKAKVSKGFEAINTLLMSVVGQQRATLETKKNPITDDYQISSNVLGLGQCQIITPFYDLSQKRWSVWASILGISVPKQIPSTVLLVIAPIENKQNTSKQVEFESSHVRSIHKHRTRDRG